MAARLRAGVGHRHFSSRIRLARNLADFPFIARATDADRAEIGKILRGRIEKLHDVGQVTGQLLYVDVSELEAVDRQFLVERQLISREHAEAEGARAVVIDQHEQVSVMINEEDHLRIQVMHSGLDLHAAWEQINQLDDLIEAQRHLRLQRAARLSHRLPDERRHRRAGERDAAPAGAGDHAADRKGVSQPAEDQPGRPRPVRRRLAGEGRLLPDQQPDHARAERGRPGQEGGRRRAGADRLRAAGPRLS